VIRGNEASCTYVEPLEDGKTRALRARLEYLEAQVREISSSLTAAESAQTQEPLEDTDISLKDQFSKLRIQYKDDQAVYYGPNCRFGIISEYPEIRQRTCPVRRQNSVFRILANSFSIRFSIRINDKNVHFTNFQMRLNIVLNEYINTVCNA